MTFKLDPYNSFFWLLGRTEPFIIQYALRLEGRLKKPLMEQALQLLQRQHPMLQHTVAKQRPFMVRPTRRPIPLFIHPRRRDDSYQDAMQAARLRPMPVRSGDTIMRVDWVRGTAAHEVIVSIEHTFSDFRSLVGLACDLLKFLDQLHDGQRDIKIDLYPLYPELKTLLPRHKPALPPPDMVVPFGDGTPLAASPPFRYAPAHCHTLSEAQSRALVVEAKAHGCTVQGVLCAAMIITLNRHAAEQGLGGESFCFTPCDLRSYLNVQMTGRELGNYVTGIFHPFKVGARQDFWKLAVAISQQIRTTIASDLFARDTDGLSGLYHPRMTSPQAMQIMKARDFCGFVSNAGPVPFAPEYRHFTLKQVRAGVSSPIMSGRRHLFWLAAQTIRGRTQLELLDTGIGDQRDKFARFMRAIVDVVFAAMDHPPQGD